MWVLFSMSIGADLQEFGPRVAIYEDDYEHE